MKLKVGDKVILKGTKSVVGNNFDRYFKIRKKGDIVTIHEFSEKGFFVTKEGCKEKSGCLCSDDVIPLSWKARFENV